MKKQTKNVDPEKGKKFNILYLWMFFRKVVAAADAVDFGHSITPRIHGEQIAEPTPLIYSGMTTD